MRLTLVLALAVLLSVLRPAAAAQATPPPRTSLESSATTVVEATTAGDTKPAKGPESASPDPQPKPADEKEQEQSKRGTIVAAPLPISSPALGSGIIPILGYIFPFSRHDKVSPPSVIGAAGLITNNGSRGFLVGTQLYFKEDRFQILTVFAKGNLNYNIYGTNLGPGDVGFKLPLSQTGHVFYAQPMINVGHHIFIGPRAWVGSSVITIQQNDHDVQPPPDIGLHTTLVALGAAVIRDTRENRFYPTQGSLVQFTSDFFSKSLGSKYSFQSYRFTFNKYWSITEHQVLAYDLYLCGTGGQPPFYGECVYGASNELRGYAAGRYFDVFMAATQAEYRLSLPWRLGVVGFGGLGGVSPGEDKLRNGYFLPDIGAGLRFELSKKYHVNLRADVARGRDSHTWSLGVGEAF